MWMRAYRGSNISSTEKDVILRIWKEWSAIDSLTTVRKSNLSGKVKREFFQAVAMQYYCMAAPGGLKQKKLMGTT